MSRYLAPCSARYNRAAHAITSSFVMAFLYLFMLDHHTPPPHVLFEYAFSHT